MMIHKERNGTACRLTAFANTGRYSCRSRRYLFRNMQEGFSGSCVPFQYPNFFGKSLPAMKFSVGNKEKIQPSNRE